MEKKKLRIFPLILGKLLTTGIVQQKNSIFFTHLLFNINIPFYFSRAGIKGLFVLMPILGVGWILGLFAVNRNTIVFEYAFAIINGLQVDLKTFLLVSFIFLLN